MRFDARLGRRDQRVGWVLVGNFDVAPVTHVDFEVKAAIVLAILLMQA